MNLNIESIESFKRNTKDRQTSRILFAYQFPPRDIKSFSGADWICQTHTSGWHWMNNASGIAIKSRCKRHFSKIDSILLPHENSLFFSFLNGKLESHECRGKVELFRVWSQFHHPRTRSASTLSFTWRMSQAIIQTRSQN